MSDAPVGSLSIPGRRGGMLRNGGTSTKKQTGRPPNIIRQGFRNDLPTEVRKLRGHVKAMEQAVAAIEATFATPPTSNQLRSRLAMAERLFNARRQLADFLAKYGIGTTITETDTSGNDVIIRVHREPRTLVGDN